MAGGRPSKFMSKYCDEIVSFMAHGKSAVQFANDIGIAKSTLYKWAQENEEFSDSLERAQDASEAFWENWIQKGAIEGAQVNVAALALILKCRFGWRDKDAAVLNNPKNDKEERADAADKLRMGVMRK